MNENYLEEKRAYDLRLAEWLGLDPTKVIAIHEDKPDRYGQVSIKWESIDHQQTADPHEGRADMPLSGWGASDEAPTFGLGVELDGLEVERMREAIGAPPELLSFGEIAVLDKLAREAL